MATCARSWSAARPSWASRRSVRFPGQLERERAARYVSAADVYVVPSIRDQGGNVDGLPNALLEGMGAARPIVASRVAGIPDVIADGEHGLLTPERDPAALAAAISRLLGDRALAERLGAAARRRVLEELTWDATAERFEAVYCRVHARTVRRMDAVETGRIVERRSMSKHSRARRYLLNR